MEQGRGSLFPLAVRGWFAIVGYVNLRGSHPILNPSGSVAALRVGLADLNPRTRPDAGAEFVAGLRQAFEWGGLPGWAGRTDAPQREIEYLRSQLQPI
jgi:hypothetical protein